jgi:hypothetical protein
MAKWQVSRLFEVVQEGILGDGRLSPVGKVEERKQEVMIVTPTREHTNHTRLHPINPRIVQPLSAFRNVHSTSNRGRKASCPLASPLCVDTQFQAGFSLSHSSPLPLLSPGVILEGTHWFRVSRQWVVVRTRIPSICIGCRSQTHGWQLEEGRWEPALRSKNPDGSGGSR